MRTKTGMPVACAASGRPFGPSAMACGLAWLATSAGALACRPSDVLSVPPPAGVTPSSAYQNQAGAEALAISGRAQVFQGFAEYFDGLLEWSSVLTDEFSWQSFGIYGGFANIDARMTTGVGGFQETGDEPLQVLLSGRVTLLSAVDALKKYEPTSGRTKIGEAYALVGYVELLAAEDYCAGLPLGRLIAGVGVSYGTPLTTDSLLGVAEVDFDSAMAYGSGADSVLGLASVGLARARLDRGHYPQAAAAVSTVPTSFVYNAELPTTYSSTTGLPNLYAYEATNCSSATVADGKGQNGLHFISAGDPRLVLSTTVAQSCDGLYFGLPDSVWYYPLKFGNPSTNIPIATGVEARLVEAEAALQAAQAPAWAADLNALRADSADTKVVFANLLPADSTTTASQAEQVDVMFRERAFWLFGTGTRLGDLRRLIRQYGRDQSTVFPTGPYPNGQNPKLPKPIPTYGTDVDFPLPTPGNGFADPNPAYKGCLVSPKVA